MKKIIFIILIAFSVSCSDLINESLDDITTGYPICVDSNASAGGDGRGWEHAVQTIEEALLLVKAGGEIWVKAGTYPVTASITLDSSNQTITIAGGFNGTEDRIEERDLTTYATNMNITYSSSTNAPIAVSDTNNIIIDGFTFTGGDISIAAIKVEDSDAITLRNLTFDSIVNSNITSDTTGAGLNINNSTVTVTDCTFDNNNATGPGGAIYSTGNSNLTISSSVFSNNNGGDGGVIFINSGSTVTISESDFLNNIGSSNGGAINIRDSSSSLIISNSTFSDNSTGSDGGAIWNNDATVEINSSTISSNTVNSTHDGGGIHFNEGTLTLYNTQITGNGGGERGGGIRISGGGVITINESTISSNTARYGGGIMCGGTDSMLTINNTEISNNGNLTNGAFGGGIDINGGTLTVSGCKFLNNNMGGGAVSNGGAIYLQPGYPCIIENSLFYSNTVEDNGGALFVDTPPVATGNSLFINLTFYENSAGYGGGIHFYDGDNDVYNSVFYNNTAGGVSQGANIFGDTIAIGQDVFEIRYCSYDGNVDGTVDEISGTENNYSLTLPFYSTIENDSYFLYPASNIRNNGTTTITGYTMPSTDLAGNTRIVNGIDRGAYEWQ